MKVIFWCENMALETFNVFIIGCAVGLVAGIIATRLFFKFSFEQKTIGQVIEYGMIHDKISKLRSTTTILNRVVADIQEYSDEITERLEISKDIEENIILPNKKTDKK
jgi:hypothetical protein